MSDQLKCPSCAGPMKLGEFAPGDKIAKCPYCGKIIDLPDDNRKQKEKITEYKERKKGKNYTVDRHVRVVERSSHTKSGDIEIKNSKDLDLILNKLQEMGKDGEIEVEFTTDGKNDIEWNKLKIDVTESDEEEIVLDPTDPAVDDDPFLSQVKKALYSDKSNFSSSIKDDSTVIIMDKKETGIFRKILEHLGLVSKK